MRNTFISHQAESELNFHIQHWKFEASTLMISVKVDRPSLYIIPFKNLVWSGVRFLFIIGFALLGYNKTRLKQ